MNHTFEIPMSTFGPLRPGQTSISLELFGTANGATGPHLPVELLRAGDTVAWSVPVPPGVSVVGWQTEFNNKIATFSANGGPQLSYEPPLYPAGYNPNTDAKPTAPARALQVATLGITALQDVLLMTLRITWTITDPAMYEAWRTNGTAEPAPAPAPEPHEERTLRLIGEAGLIPPLMLLANETDPTRFILRTKESGTWEGMLRLIRLASD